ncbi:hypothetical protein ACF0H5_018750 [Mactra antiquata]
MKLLSDNPRKTCTEISASSDRIGYICTSLIKDFPKAMIKYCPVEICQDNGTWSKPSISCALSECYVPGRSEKYIGHRLCTGSGRLCQRWDSQVPHRHRFQHSHMFPDQTVALAEAFCRDPDGSKGAPWCFTSDPEKKWEFCDVTSCLDIEQYDGSCSAKPRKQSTDTINNDDDSQVRKSINDSTCSNQIRYDIYKDYRLRSKVLQERITRSILECTSLCSIMTSCIATTYRADDRKCSLHVGKEMTFVKSRGHKSCIKDCSPGKFSVI